MSTDLETRVGALRSALAAAGDVIDASHTRPAAESFEHVNQRLSLSTDHTVVALAGATGSGKSSLFNRLVGLELAEVGYLRPTTATALACAWGPVGATDLLDWIGISRREQIARRGVLDATRDDELEGLVLIDLPDHDSIARANQDVVDQVAMHADLFVWVLDPQKYADMAIHARYLRPLVTHRGATVIVMNQADRLSESDLSIALADLERILAEEGLGDVPVMATSAMTGAGVAELRTEIARRIGSKGVSQTRLAADLSAVARNLATVGGVTAAPGIDRESRDRLVEIFVECAGVTQIAEAVEESFARRAVMATDWPLISWVGRLRHDPLSEVQSGASARDAVADLTPITASVQRAQADLALRELTGQATEGLSRRWRTSIMDSVHGTGTRDVIDELDEAIAGVDLQLDRRPWWWTAAAVLQWVTVAAVLVGLVWWVAALAGLVDPDVPGGAMTVPAILVAGGLVVGVGLTLVTRWRVGVEARQAGDRAGQQLRQTISRTAERVVMARLRNELERYERWRSGLAVASV